MIKRDANKLIFCFIFQHLHHCPLFHQNVFCTITRQLIFPAKIFLFISNFTWLQIFSSEIPAIFLSINFCTSLLNRKNSSKKRKHLNILFFFFFVCLSFDVHRSLSDYYLRLKSGNIFHHHTTNYLIISTNCLDRQNENSFGLTFCTHYKLFRHIMEFLKKHFQNWRDAQYIFLILPIFENSSFSGTQNGIKDIIITTEKMLFFFSLSFCLTQVICFYC